jgi:ADP-dependent NAD(P)H-hydrate dehydratase / NAD(P)H-hydrate epimerase
MPTQPSPQLLNQAPSGLRTSPQRVLPHNERTRAASAARDLHDIAATRRVEGLYAAQLPPHTLMQRAGLSVARLALALYPHAQTIWIACGPGNNGGDGLEAASHLQRWGKTVHLTWLGTPERCSADTLASFEQARQSGVVVAAEPPQQHDLAIDALLGIGASTAANTASTNAAPRDIDARMAEWIALMNQGRSPVLAVDLPSGLQADTGFATPRTVHAHHTLSLLTLKPGLFTAQGRDHCGDIWFDPLGCDATALAGETATARLSATPRAANRARAAHGSHKGSFGDVVVIGGAPGMGGAALLAARAALHAGAGRVLVGLLDDGVTDPSISVDAHQPELMFRPVESLDVRSAVAVCGCGGGDAVRRHLPRVLATAAVAVLDADALNAIAQDANLQTQLQRRAGRNQPTVLTPHPLEAARLLGLTTPQIQADRLACAQQLAARFACTVVLKGSGSVIAAAGHVSHINPSGNALLATAGTGDVLAGMIGAALAALASSASLAEGRDAFEAVVDAVYRHGRAADQWPPATPMTASALARRCA